MPSSASISKRYQKPHLWGTAPGYRGSSSLSVETQKLLDHVGQSSKSSRLAPDEAVSVSRPKHACSTNMPQLHVTLKPRVLPKADDLSGVSSMGLRVLEHPPQLRQTIVTYLADSAMAQPQHLPGYSQS